MNTTFSKLERALHVTVDYALQNKQDVFVSVIKYGRPEAPQYEFRLRLQDEILDITAPNICYRCKSTGENEQLNPLYYENAETTE